jgi:hypothetical protein
LPLAVEEPPTTNSDKEAEAEPDDDASESNEEPPTKKPRGSSGTFAGRRPPKDPAGLELFELKKQKYTETREELMKKYPGRISNLIGRSTSQANWWNHLRLELSRMKCKATKKNPVTKEQIRETIDAAAVSWKAKVDAMAAKL